MSEELLDLAHARPTLQRVGGNECRIVCGETLSPGLRPAPRAGSPSTRSAATGARPESSGRTRWNHGLGLPRQDGRAPGTHRGPPLRTTPRARSVPCAPYRTGAPPARRRPGRGRRRSRRQLRTLARPSRTGVPTGHSRAGRSASRSRGHVQESADLVDRQRLGQVAARSRRPQLGGGINPNKAFRERVLVQASDRCGGASNRRGRRGRARSPPPDPRASSCSPQCRAR